MHKFCNKEEVVTDSHGPINFNGCPFFSYNLCVAVLEICGEYLMIYEDKILSCNFIFYPTNARIIQSQGGIVYSGSLRNKKPNSDK